MRRDAMRRRRAAGAWPALAAAVALIVLTAPAPGGEATVDPQARTATEQFLSLIDSGLYAASWETASPYFRQVIAKAEWIKRLNAYRAPLGAAVRRTLAESEEATSLPGEPDAHYIVHFYETDFANKRESVETVTVREEADGSWRIVGYYIR